MAIKRGVYIASLIGMLILLIVDTKTAVTGAFAGIELCLKSVIPSLFPFLIISSLMGAAMGNNHYALAPLGKLCNMPSGCENILFLGLLGGYPVGAKLVAQQYEAGNLPEENAHRLMGFCNNPGPAFIFGMLWDAFHNKYTLWALWGVQIISSLLVGIILPRQKTIGKAQSENASQSIVETLSTCVRTMANICGWIVIFRVVIAYLQLYLFPFVPDTMQVIFAGILELTNGCHMLTQLQSVPLRFVLCSGMLSFGGICVTLQTASTAAKLGLGWYLPGKILQTAFSIMISTLLQGIIFLDSVSATIPITLCFVVIGILYFTIFRKNSSNSVKYAV